MTEAPKAVFALSPALLLLPLLSACSGVAGTSTIHREEQNGAVIYTIETRGAEVRNSPGSRGCTLGRRTTRLAYDARKAPPPEKEHTRGWSPLPQARPLWVQTTGTGLDFGTDFGFPHFSLGRWHRSTACLHAADAAVLTVANRTHSPLKVSLQHTTP